MPAALLDIRRVAACLFSRAGLPACLLLAGCAGSSVRIPHFAPAGDAEARRAARLGSVYVLAERADTDESPFGGLLDLYARRDAELRLPWADAEELARVTAARLRSAGAPTVYFRVARPGEADPYAARLRPSSVLRLRPAGVALAWQKGAMKVARGKKAGQNPAVEGSSATWVVTARLTLRAELSGPEGGAPESFEESFSRSWETGAKPDSRSWRKDHERELIAGAAEALVRRLAPRSVSRVRRLFKTGADAAGWAAAWNAGVEAERDGRYGAAWEHYAAARAAAADSRDLAKVDWAGLQADLAGGAAPAAEAEGWFSPSLAVLPFSDQTNSVEGPEAARKVAQKVLRDGGYAVLPLERVDEVLREKGFTQGGQLKTAKPEELAGWLGADRLLFCDVEYFQLLPAPTVAGELSVWGSRPAGPLLSARAWGVAEDWAGEGRMALGKVMDESWTGVLLLPAPETFRFVRRALESLPQRAPR